MSIKLSNAVSPSPVPDHQLRVFNELAQLTDAIEKTSDFIYSEKFKELCSFERELIQRKYKLMGEFASVLIDQLEYWGWTL